MSDLVVSVRQISSYPALTQASGSENILLQIAGLGGPYQSITSAALVATALQNSGRLGVGEVPPANAIGSEVFTGNFVLQQGGGIWFNAYTGPAGTTSWNSGPVGLFNVEQAIGFEWLLGQGVSGQAPVLSSVMTLNNAGALALPFGTLTVARDPAAALEVATMGYVGNHTVASFNGRNGFVTLSQSDIYQTLCLDSPIASQQWVNGAITAGLQGMLYTCPFVNRWNGRTGSVNLMLSDITCVFFQPGQQPISPTPPATSNDNSIATTQWVVEYIANELAGGGTTLATQAWVLANTVNSFNGRMGAVTLGLADITQAGGAPLQSPQLAGVPTAPTQAVGNASSAIATTAFVWQAVQESTTGVVSFNTRTGVITLDAADINDAGGALLASPQFSGVPTAPTAPVGTSTGQLATTAFVLAEVQAIGSGVVSFNTRTGAVTLQLADITGAGGAPIASPAFTGTPTVPTPVSPIAATTTIPNTNWVVQYVTLNAVSSFNSRTGAVTLNANDITAAGGLANPNVALTGVPTAPTAAPNTNTTQVATCAYVAQAIGNVGGAYVPLAGNATISGPLTMSGATATITLNGNATQLLQAVPLQQLQLYAPLASPALSGVPTAPTAALNTSTTQLATCAFVANAIAGIVGIVVSATAPATPSAGQGWFDMTKAELFVWTGTTWVIAVNPPTVSTANFVQITGSTMTGSLAINSANALTLTGSSITDTSLSVLNGRVVVGTPAAPSQGIFYNAPTLIGGGVGFAFGYDNTTAPANASFNVTISGSQVGWAVRTFAQAGNWAPMLVVATNSAVNQATAWLNGAVSCTWSIAASDDRLKHNQAEPSKDALGIVQATPVYQCDYQHPAASASEHLDFTIIAQDVRRVLPHAYMPPPDEDGFASLHPLHLIATLWRAVQQLSTKIETLEAHA